MTDYWKSQERKFCDFCKCWITDNKVSVQFHENGKRHKENVAKKISELTKKSTKAHKENQKINEEMKKMEEAALKAYMADIEANPDLTSHNYKQIQVEKAEAQKEEVKEIVKKVVERKKEVPKPVATKTWYEAKSEEGHTYYWNVNSNESSWEAPKEGYISIEEQQQISETETRLQENQKKEANEEVRAWAAREEMKKFKKVEEPKVVEYPGPILGPAPKVDPYGSWKPVEKKIEKPINWQLPKVAKSTEIAVPEVVEPKPIIKERKISSLGDTADDIPAVFKKRKPNPNRGNMRKPIDEED